MSKTTIYIALSIGAQQPAFPAYIAFQSPYRFVSGSTVVLPEPAPVALGSDGTATVSVDPGVWIVDEIMPTGVRRRAVAVPEASGVIPYAELREVSNPVEVGYGPTWAATAQRASAEAVTAVEDAKNAIADANDIITRAQAVFDGLPVTTDAIITDVAQNGGSAFAAFLRGALAGSRDITSWIASDHGIIPETQSGSGAALIGQHTAINAACVALSDAGGGRLILPKGFKVVIAGALRGASNVIIHLEPGAAIKFAEHLTTANLAGDFVGLSNFGFTGELGSSFDLGIRDTPDPVASPVRSLRFTDCRSITIRGMSFPRLFARALDFRGTTAGTNGIKGCSDIRVLDNYFAEAADVCIYVADNSQNAPTTDIIIAGNTFEGIRKVAPVVNGVEPIWAVVYLSRTLRFIVRENRVVASADTALSLGTGCTDGLVIGNHFRSTQVGIYLGAVTRVRVQANDIASSNDMGIHLYNTVGAGAGRASVIITANEIHDCAKPAVLVEGGQVVVVTSNIITSVATRANDFADIYKGAIAMQGGNGTNPDTIVVTGNIIDKGTTVASTLYGVSILSTPKELVVDDNVFAGTGWSNKYRYGTLTATNYHVQTDTTVYSSNRKLALAQYADVASKTPGAGHVVYHPTHTLLIGDGNGNWRKADGTIVPANQL